jgi:hypothetical protein
MIVPCNPLVQRVTVDDITDHFDASTPRTVSIEYHIILLIPQIFSNLHRMRYKLNTLTQICNETILPCNPLIGMVTGNDATYNFDASKPRTVSIEYKIIDPPEYNNILKWCTQSGIRIGYQVPNM